MTRPLNGNDAVSLAAEQARSTAGRNISDLPGLPVPADTANLRQGPDIHEGLLALLPLVGVWRGTGRRNAADGDHGVGVQIVFSHDGQNHLRHDIRVWRLDEGRAPAEDDAAPEGAAAPEEAAEPGEGAGAPETPAPGVAPLYRETGFWRISDSDELEVVAAHSTGAVEIFYGEPISERAWEMRSASTMVTATGPADLGAGRRLFGLMPNNDLGWVDERMVAEEFVPRISAELSRWAG
ncbi:FABP family protein [Corynebacterium sphenisci]|uniref:FABP family protein n=1 Tax=Corynebacterium sphenisci TaxID=191493 RepID=UPI0026E06DDB|nr:FABP family protein [Corynebacterium sphenisci]MDO5730184.1 FABP family protein [Corynebacterium sphenisci]